MLEEGGLIHNWMCYFKNGHKMTHRAFGNEVLWCSSICPTVVTLIIHLLWRRSLSLWFGYQSKFQGICVISIIYNYGFEALAHLEQIPF